MPRKIVIVGGSLGGAAAAARIRSLDSQAEIVLLEKSATIMHAGTAWPGLLADDTTTPRGQHSMTAEEFQRQYRVDVRTNSEAVAVHRLRRLVEIRTASDPHGKPYKEKYDFIILATGVLPVKPPVFSDAIDGVFFFKSPADVLQIRSWLQRPQGRRVVVVGGTPPGLQAASALLSRGLEVTLVESSNHVLSAFDPDLARLVEGHVRRSGLVLKLSRQVVQVSRQDGQLSLQLDDQSILYADMVLLAAGIRPDNALAVKAGLKTGLYDCLQVSASGQTTDKRIFAVGSLVCSADLVTGKPVWLTSASAVIRQARISAEFLCNRRVSLQGTLNFAAVTLPDLEAGACGAGESELLAGKVAYNRTYAIIKGDVSQPFLAAKLLWSRQNRRLLGGQLVSGGPVQDKLSLLALSLQSRLTVDDLARIDMPSDPLRPGQRHWLTQAGQQAQNVLENLVSDFSIYDLAALDTSRVFLADVRTRDEYLAGSIPGAACLPLGELLAGLQSGRTDLVPAGPVYLFSETGRQGYLAARALAQAGRQEVYNLAGGYWLYKQVIS